MNAKGPGLSQRIRAANSEAEIVTLLKESEKYANAGEVSRRRWISSAVRRAHQLAVQPAAKAIEKEDAKLPAAR